MADCSTSSRFCEEIAQIAGIVRIIQITKTGTLASLALYLYDFVLTYEDEYLYMWNATFGLGKAVYFLLRYFTLFVVLFINIVIFMPAPSTTMYVAASPSKLFISTFIPGLTWIRFQWVAGVIIGALTELALLLPIYAFCNKSRKILAFVIFCMLLTGAGMMGIAAKVMSTEGADAFRLGPDPDFHMCVPTNLNGVYKAFWIPFIMVEVLLLLLALGRWFQISKLRGVQASSTDQMIKDSVLYFVGTFPFSTLSMLMWIIGGNNYIEFPVGFIIAMGSIMSQRVLVNIRKYHQGQLSLHTRGRLGMPGGGNAKRFAMSININDYNTSINNANNNGNNNNNNNFELVNIGRSRSELNSQSDDYRYP